MTIPATSEWTPAMADAEIDAFDALIAEINARRQKLIDAGRVVVR